MIEMQMAIEDVSFDGEDMLINDVINRESSLYIYIYHIDITYICIYIYICMYVYQQLSIQW